MDILRHIGKVRHEEQAMRYKGGVKAEGGGIGRDGAIHWSDLLRLFFMESFDVAEDLNTWVAVEEILLILMC